jgi:hypothetical protein
MELKSEPCAYKANALRLSHTPAPKALTRFKKKKALPLHSRIQVWWKTEFKFAHHTISPNTQIHRNTAAWAKTAFGLQSDEG